MSGATIVQPLGLRRREFFADYDGVLTTEKRYDEIKDYTLDLTDWLDSSETINSVAWQYSGVSDEGSSNTTTSITARISGLGEIIATIVTTEDEGISTDRKLEIKLRFRSVNTFIQDYR